MKVFLFLFLAMISNSFCQEDVVLKSLTFHYNEYPNSKYTNTLAVVNWSSQDGQIRFARSKFKGDFFRLAHHFKAQVDPAMCGQASATIVLSAIYELNKKPMPIIEEWPIEIGGKKYPLQYRGWNYGNFFNEATEKILNKNAISMRARKKDGNFGGGIDMHELQKMLSVHGLTSKVFQIQDASDKELQKFKILLKDVLNSEKKFLILNYDHSYKGLMGGHYSSPVAYDEETDSVLILDVASHRNPWVWISLFDLFNAMNTKNYTQTANRGYILVSSVLN